MIARKPFHILHEEYGGGRITWLGCFDQPNTARRFRNRMLERGMVGTLVVAEVVDVVTMEPSMHRRDA